MMRIRSSLQTTLASLAIAIAFVGGEAVAVTGVVPNAQAAAEGNDSSFGPFFNSSVRYQQVYRWDQFSTSLPLTITQIAFRPDGSVTDPNLFIVGTSVHVELSTTSRYPETLSTVFADNVGADVQTVYDGPVTSGTVSGPAGGPKDFTIAIDVAPFVYDPSEGNLLLDVRATSSGISAVLDAQSGFDPALNTAHVDAPSIGATSGSYVGKGLVTRFQFTTPPKTVWAQEYAFAWADQPATATYTPSITYSYNHLGGSIQISRSSPGVYSVQFASFGALSGGGNVQVTAYGSFGGIGGKYCKVSSWGSDTVFVRCFDAAGAAADSYFTVLYIKTPSLPAAVAYAWANNSTASSYSPSSLYSYNPGGGAITATRTSTGRYVMQWGGFESIGGPTGGQPHVTAYDASSKRCQIEGWGGDTVFVVCFDSAGNPADSLYSVLYVRPQASDDGLAFARADRPTYPSYTPDWFDSFNSGDGAITATRTGTGVYAMRFTGIALRGLGGGHVQVNGHGFPADKRCSVASWSSEVVNVRCNNAAGAPVDAEYNVLFIKPVTAPEPGRSAILAAGIALLGLLARRRRR